MLDFLMVELQLVFTIAPLFGGAGGLRRQTAMLFV